MAVADDEAAPVVAEHVVDLLTSERDALAAQHVVLGSDRRDEGCVGWKQIQIPGRNNSLKIVTGCLNFCLSPQTAVMHANLNT